MAVALLRAHLREAVLAVQVIGADDGAGTVAARPTGARVAYDVLVGKLVEAGMQLNLTKSGVVAFSAVGQGAARAAFAQGPRGGHLLGQASPAHPPAAGGPGPQAGGPC